MNHFDQILELASSLQRQESILVKQRQEATVKIGFLMRKSRENSGLSIRKTASLLKCSAAFLSDMELGRRRQSIEWIRKTNAIIAESNHHTHDARD